MDSSFVSEQNVETRLLKYVLVVAEELHFSRAARRLHLSPPSLSRQIKELEVRLGYVLFERRTRDVLLTAAGSAFVTEARQPLLHAQLAVKYGYAASRGDTDPFWVGYSPWFRPSVLLRLQEEFQIRFPTRSFGMQSVYPATQIEMLLQGHLQAGIAELPVQVSGLQAVSVWHEKLLAAVPRNHPLAGCRMLSRDEIAVEPVIWLTKSLHPVLYEHLLDWLKTPGREPDVAFEVHSVAEMLDLVTAGAGIGFVKQSIAAFINTRHVVFRELRGPELAIETGVIYRLQNYSEALRTFVDLVRKQRDQRVASRSGALPSHSA